MRLGEPFFSRFIKSQKPINNLTTKKYPSDNDEDIVTTAKYPSDSDEEMAVTLKYPSDNDEDL